jgi:hypothetical protein
MGKAPTPEIARAKRLKRIFVEIEKATKKGQRVSTAELEAKTGFSEGLIHSSIHLINRRMDHGYYGATKVINYRQPRNGIKGGWQVSASWEDHSRWMLTLHKHMVTRAEHLTEEADVVEALFPGKAPVGLSAAYRRMIRAADVAGALIEPLRGIKGKVPKVKANRRVKLVP